ncbi:MAG: CDP-glucose 4,6-dehydratase [Lentisphaerae bacterium RIFOXYA12_FULL_48_11]|nr:MAG: CDP-glucose 4,6-dehydratase [Lentisphaerae bacterium RIFOXYA12_FULL_48_11]
MNGKFWKGKRVFVTGHTGFKGSWLCIWLSSLGARVYGYALSPPTEPSLFKLCRVKKLVTSTTGDVRNLRSLQKTMLSTEPEIVIHMAAQPLVRESYRLPVETYEINVMGTVNLLEAVRTCKSVKAVVNVTTDKCYENRERLRGYREDEPMGGYDPYSNSKACSELVTSAYRNSYFNPSDHAEHGVAVATARAGNVIGGGDWAADRLIPDCIRAILRGETVRIRNPDSTRPWQHVLEPLSGYMMLAQKLYSKGPRYASGWNFGPDNSDARPVGWVLEEFCRQWGAGASYVVDSGHHPHEAHYLSLNCSKARKELGWQPRWNLKQALGSIVEWTRAYARKEDVKRICLKQIKEYSERVTNLE